MMEESNAIGGGIEIEPSDPNQEFKEWEENKNLEWEENNLREMGESSPDGRKLEQFPEEHRPYPNTRREIPGNIKLFGDRNHEFIDAVKVFDFLLLEDECTNPYFIKWLMDKKDFGVTQTQVYDFEYRSETLSLSNRAVSLINEKYELRYRGIGANNDMTFRRFNVDNGGVDAQDHITAITEIREYYDQYKKEELNKIMKRAGIATAIGLSLIATITGLALGLKRKGNDMVRAGEKKPWSKITHASPPARTPWSEIESASGKGLIFIGDNIYLVIGGTLIYLYTRK